MTKKKIRTLLAAGASVRAVMKDAGLCQAKVASTCGWPQSRVATVLAGDRGGKRRAGRRTALDVYEAVADLLGIKVRDMPEAKNLLETIQQEQTT